VARAERPQRIGRSDHLLRLGHRPGSQNATGRVGDVACPVGHGAFHAGTLPESCDQAPSLGGTVVRVETDADGHAAYEAHMLEADGTPTTVYVDASFNFVGIG
jgi:hypothetical protein